MTNKDIAMLELYNSLTSEQQLCIYHTKRKEFVVDDIMCGVFDEDFPSRFNCELPSEEEQRAVAEAVAEMYENGNHDCNLDYWDNLENLTVKVMGMY